MWKPEHCLAAERRGLRYPSDLTDAEWALVAPLIPPAPWHGTLTGPTATTFWRFSLSLKTQRRFDADEAARRLSFARAKARGRHSRFRASSLTLFRPGQNQPPLRGRLKGVMIALC